MYQMPDNDPHSEEVISETGDDAVSHQDYMAYMAGMQVEALMRVYDTNLVLLSKLTGSYELADSIIEMHSQGRYYFPPPVLPPDSSGPAPDDPNPQPQD